MTSCTSYACHLPLYLSLIALLGCCGCSTVIEGRTEQITVNSSPQGAQCLLRQADNIVARVTTPGSAEVTKTKNDLVVFCSKSGYESASVNNHSDYSIASLGNMVLGQYSFIGNAVDSVSGASNKYDSKVFITLQPAETPLAFQPPPGAPAVVKLSEQVATAMSLQVPMPGAPVALSKAAPIVVSKDAPVAVDSQATFQAVPVVPVASAEIQPHAKLPFAAPWEKAGNPSLNAAAVLANAAKQASTRFQVPAQSYAEAMNESSRRPPFNVDQ